MKYVRSFVLFWWDFIVGDDWRVAVGVAVGLALTAAFEVWWLLPPGGGHRALRLAQARSSGVAGPRLTDRGVSRRDPSPEV